MLIRINSLAKSVEELNKFLTKTHNYFSNQKRSKELSDIDKKLLDINNFFKNNIENLKNYFDSMGIEKILNYINFAFTVCGLEGPSKSEPIKLIQKSLTELTQKLREYKF